MNGSVKNAFAVGEVVVLEDLHRRLQAAHISMCHEGVVVLQSNGVVSKLSLEVLLDTLIILLVTLEVRHVDFGKAVLKTAVSDFEVDGRLSVGAS